MKKVITLIALVAFIAASAFAGANYIGVTVGPNFGWINEKFGFDITADNSTAQATANQILSSAFKDKSFNEYGLSIAIDGANYFAEFGSFSLGVAYQIGGALDFAVIENGVSQKGYNNTFYIRPTVAALYNFNDSIGLDVRFGAGYNFVGTENKTNESQKSLATVHSIELFGSIGINYVLTQSWGIRAGVQVGGNVWSSVSAKAATTLTGGQYKDLDTVANGALVSYGQSAKAKVDVAYNHIYLTPYVGFTYAY